MHVTKFKQRKAESGIFMLSEMLKAFMNTAYHKHWLKTAKNTETKILWYKMADQ